jgi:site-specific DNA recombinase
VRPSDGRHHIRDETRYRCRYPLEYALANDVDHPRTVHVREDWIGEALDAWLLQLFEPEQIDETVAQLAAADAPTSADAARIETARRQLVDCDARLAKYRAALEHGTDPTVVAAWIAEVEGERLAAERTLAEARPSPALSPGELRRMISELGDLRPVLADADPSLKAAVYADLGVTLTYRPASETVAVAAQPMLSKVRVGGATGPECQRAVLRGALVRAPTRASR